jgi:hypothetical protein
MEVLPRQAGVHQQAVGQLWGMGAPCMATHDAAQDVAPRSLVCCVCSAKFIKCRLHFPLLILIGQAMFFIIVRARRETRAQQGFASVEEREDEATSCGGEGRRGSQIGSRQMLQSAWAHWLTDGRDQLTVTGTVVQGGEFFAGCASNSKGCRVQKFVQGPREVREGKAKR